MGDFYQNGLVTTLHNLRLRSLDDLEKNLLYFSKNENNNTAAMTTANPMTSQRRIRLFIINRPMKRKKGCQADPFIIIIEEIRVTAQQVG